MLIPGSSTRSGSRTRSWGAARQRFAVLQNKKPAEVESPRWRPFQLAFVLMNLPGIVNPLDQDLAVVDLLFFPTGGGKTEAYLGLAAFTLVYRRLTNADIESAGLSVLMRYTLRGCECSATVPSKPGWRLGVDLDRNLIPELQSGGESAITRRPQHRNVRLSSAFSFFFTHPVTWAIAARTVTW